MSIFARSLDELRDGCGAHGPAAVADVRWGAALGYLVWREGFRLRNAPSDAIEAIIACRSDDRVKLGYPVALDGLPHVSVIDAHTPDEAARLRRIGEETLADWEAAWCPGLTAAGICWEHQYILACQAQPQRKRPRGH